MQHKMSIRDSDETDLSDLSKLYIDYLKRLCPDWSEKRIRAEAESVFKEQRLEDSEQRRQEFLEKITAKLQHINNHPDDWFLHENGIND